MIIIIAKLIALILFFVACATVTKRIVAERPILLASRVPTRTQVIAILLMWLCIWVPLAVLGPSMGWFLLDPLPFGALLAIPGILMFRSLRDVLQRQGTDRTRNAQNAVDRGLLVGYASAVLAVADWGLGLAISSLATITGG